MQQPLWVTSFAADMYEVSGKGLRQSFLDSGSIGTLVIAHEGLTAEEMSALAAPNVVAFDVGVTAYLQDWLHRNRAYIPVHLGGRGSVCRCPGGPLLPHDKRHRMPCIGHWFNRNASRWFRKFAAIRHILNSAYFGETPLADRTLIWVDADCRFSRQVTAQTVAQWFPGRAAIFYHKHQRPVLEAGVVGYRLGQGARKVLDEVFRLYDTGRYRREKRWDDSYILQVAMKNVPQVTTIDLAVEVGEHAAVIPSSIVGTYLDHFKGKHGRGLGIMK
jgi:hypothetical protein